MNAAMCHYQGIYVQLRLYMISRRNTATSSRSQYPRIGALIYLDLIAAGESFSMCISLRRLEDGRTNDTLFAYASVGQKDEMEACNRAESTMKGSSLCRLCQDSLEGCRNAAKEIARKT